MNEIKISLKKYIKVLIENSIFYYIVKDYIYLKNWSNDIKRKRLINKIFIEILKSYCLKNNIKYVSDLSKIDSNKFIEYYNKYELDFIESYIY